MLARMWSEDALMHCLYEDQCRGSSGGWEQIYHDRSQIPLLGVYAKDTPPYYRDTWSTMIIEALFVIVRSWKQATCTTMEEWIQKIWFIYTMEYYSAIANEDIKSFASVCTTRGHS